MRTALLSMFLLVASAADAQDNESAWLVEDQSSVRFSDGDIKGARFETGTKVTIVFREGELVRIKGDDGFGWVPQTAITTEAPAGDDELDLDGALELLKNLNLESGALNPGVGAGGATSLPIKVGGEE